MFSRRYQGINLARNKSSFEIIPNHEMGLKENLCGDRLLSVDCLDHFFINLTGYRKFLRTHTITADQA